MLLEDIYITQSLKVTAEWITMYKTGYLYVKRVVLQNQIFLK